MGGNEGAFWTAQARPFDETLANCHGAFLAALRATIAEHTSDDGVTYQSATWIIQARKP